MMVHETVEEKKIIQKVKNQALLIKKAAFPLGKSSFALSMNWFVNQG